MLRPSGVEERNYFIAFWKTNVCQLKSARFDQMQFSFKEIQLEFFFLLLLLLLFFLWLMMRLTCGVLHLLGVKSAAPGRIAYSPGLVIFGGP